jgi:two-component system, OmpR family, response regulator MtrA
MTMSRVAVAHSRENVPVALVALLRDNGYDVVTAPVCRALIGELVDDMPDLVVVDGTFGDFDITRVSRDVRRSTAARVIVVLPDLADENWVMAAIEAGADDVLGPSTSPAMMLTRVMASVRGRPPPRRETDTLVVGDVVVDVDAHSVLIGGDIVRFPVRLFRMLVELARRPNKVVTCEALLQGVWGIEPHPADRRRVRVAASALRRLLGEGVYRPRLETVVRVGYRLVADTVVPIGPLAPDTAAS